MNNYDQDVLGVGNPLHPSNQKDLVDYEFESDNLKECLNHFHDTKEIEALANAIDQFSFVIDNIAIELIECISKARKLEHHDLANKLISIRTKLETYR